MFTVGGRRADVVVVAVAVAGIIVLTVAWAARAGDGGSARPDTDTLIGADVIPKAPRAARPRPVFTEDFERRSAQWREVGSAMITDRTAAEGKRSVTLTATACHGDAISRLIEVEAGASYRLRTDYRTEGDGGYIGLDLHDADGEDVGEQWLIGDGGFPTYGEVRWRYNVDERDPGDLGSWGRYSASYVIPRGVTAVAVKIEDWGCGGLPDDPASAPVHFDRIQLTPES